VALISLLNFRIGKQDDEIDKIKKEINKEDESERKKD
jgi:hypothetical protein